MSLHIKNGRLEEAFKILSEDSSGNFSRKQFVFTQRFNEYLFQCSTRYGRLCFREKEQITLGKRLFERRSAQEIQLAYVNELEGYFEQIYATLASFAMLLLNTTRSGYVPEDIVEDNKKLLTFLEKFLEGEDEGIQHLKDAKDFRNSIVHYKDRVRQDWMTFSYPMNNDIRTVIVYCVIKSAAVYARGFQTDPYDPDFEPALDYTSFYVSPRHHEIAQALNDVLAKTLEKISLDPESRPVSTDGVDPQSVEVEYGTLPKRIFARQIPIKKGTLRYMYIQLRRFLGWKIEQGSSYVYKITKLK